MATSGATTAWVVLVRTRPTSDPPTPVALVPGAWPVADEPDWLLTWPATATRPSEFSALMTTICPAGGLVFVVWVIGVPLARFVSESPVKNRNVTDAAKATFEPWAAALDRPLANRSSGAAEL